MEKSELELTMNDQIILDEVVTKIKAQGKPAYDKETARCFYRMPNDPSCRCAAGHLIPDDVYGPFMENKPAGEVIDRFRATLPPNVVDATQLVQTLQEVHDTVAKIADTDQDFMVRFLENCQALAKRRGLEWKH